MSSYFPIQDDTVLLGAVLQSESSLIILQGRLTFQSGYKALEADRIGEVKFRNPKIARLASGEFVKFNAKFLCMESSLSGNAKSCHVFGHGK